MSNSFICTLVFGRNRVYAVSWKFIVSKIVIYVNHEVSHLYSTREIFMERSTFE